MSIPAHPSRATPEIIITGRVPRTKKFYIYETQEVKFQVPVDRGDPTVWECPQVNVLKPDGTDIAILGQDIYSPINGTFAVEVDFDQLGYWHIIFFFGPAGTSIVRQHRIRVRVVQ